MNKENEESDAQTPLAEKGRCVLVENLRARQLPRGSKKINAGEEVDVSAVPWVRPSYSE